MNNENAVANPTSVYLTPQEVADHYRVSRLTIYSWIQSGKITGVKLPGGTVRIPRTAVPDYPEVQNVRHN